MVLRECFGGGGCDVMCEGGKDGWLGVLGLGRGRGGGFGVGCDGVGVWCGGSVDGGCDVVGWILAPCMPPDRLMSEFIECLT